MATESPEQIAARIELLQKYADNVRTWLLPKPPEHMRGYSRDPHEEKRAGAELFILRNKRAVAQAVADVGVVTRLIVQDPASVGGRVSRVDALENVLQMHFEVPFAHQALRFVEEAIGVYEHLRDNTGLVRLTTTREGLDVVGAIDRALRPSFRAGPPEREKDVQDAVETILNSLGIAFTREQERAPVGPRASIPDFVLAELDLVLEVKFANDKHSESAVQEEIMTDVAAYRTKWKHVLFVVYDCGAISDPDRMRRDNAQQFGVTVVIIKH